MTHPLSVRACVLAALTVIVNAVPVPVEAGEASTSTAGVGGDFAGSRVVRAGALGMLHRADPLIDHGPDGSRHQIRTDSETPEKGPTRYFFRHVHEKAGKEVVHTFGSWNSDEKHPDAWAGMVVRAAPDGTCWGLALHTTGGENDRHTELVITKDGGVSATLFKDNPIDDAQIVLGPDGQPIVFGRSGSRILRLSAEHAEEILTRSDYDWSVARDARGTVYVIAYDYSSRALVIRAADEKTWRWTDALFDGRESGWQHSVSMYKGKLYVLYYYFRNSFNKGLRLAVLWGGKSQAAPQTFFRERDINAGWEPLLGIAPDGSVEVSYLKDVQAEEKAERRFPSVDALLAERAADYSGSWEDDYKELFIVGGVEPSWRKWLMTVPTPTDIPEMNRFDARYDFDAALVTAFSLEARWRGFDIGASYARSLIQDRIEDSLGNTAAKAFQYLSGFIGWDDLIAGQDVKVSGMAGDFKGVYEDQNGVAVADTPVRELELALLSQLRIRYGLRYRTYDLRVPVYQYLAPANEKKYQFVGSGVADGNVHRLELFGGYSKLDYLTKYENSYFGLDLDVWFGGGFAYNSLTAVPGSIVPAGVLDFAFSATGRLGLLWMERVYGLHGAGFFLRAGIEGAALTTGFGNGIPSDRKDESEDDRKKLAEESRIDRAAHHQLLFGPYAGVGLIY